MDPSVCVKPTFKRPPLKRENKIKDIPDDVAQSLQKAVVRLKKEMETVEPPHPVIEIQGETGKCIVIKEVDDFLEIHRNTEVLYKTNKTVFRHVQFSSLVDCRVFVLAKAVRVFFMRCKNCQFSIRAPLIGRLEFFKCYKSKVNIRVPGEEPPIPLIMVEDCHEFHIYQSNRELFYVITQCERITGNIVDPKTNERIEEYPLGKIIWGWQERSIVMLSRDKGFASVPDSYDITGISHHLFMNINPFQTQNEKVEDLFGTTPPAAKFS